MKLIGERFDLESGATVARLPQDYVAPNVRATIEPEPDDKPGVKSRGPDILKMLEAAQQLAGAGEGNVPLHVDAIPVDRAARRQFSFSRLTGQLVRANGHAPGDDPLAVPLPQKAEIDPLRLGALVHDVVGRIDFAAKDVGTAIGDWCEHLASQYVLLNTAEAAAAARDMLVRFAASPRAKQLAQAGVIHQELEFLLAWPTGEIQGVAGVESAKGGRAPSGATGGSATREPQPPSYLHGYIDCLYQDPEGGWHVLDYKTTKAIAADVPRLAKQYEMQMYVYALAAERALGRPPAELALHFLRPGVEHVFLWDGAARKRAKILVQNAIDHLLGSGFGVQNSEAAIPCASAAES
jgi:ATP-dependent helicase/nuclease subunit A